MLRGIRQEKETFLSEKEKSKRGGRRGRNGKDYKTDIWFKGMLGNSDAYGGMRREAVG